MLAIEPQVRAFCARSLDHLVGSGGFDFIADVGAEIPMRTIGLLLGIPEEDQVALRGSIYEGLRRDEGTMPDSEAQGLRAGHQAHVYADYRGWGGRHPSPGPPTALAQSRGRSLQGVHQRAT